MVYAVPFPAGLGAQDVCWHKMLWTFWNGIWEFMGGIWEWLRRWCWWSWEGAWVWGVDFVFVPVGDGWRINLLGI